MNYNDKLKTERPRPSSVKNVIRDFNEEMESDRGRAINSAAVRRLQQKTQVFPLETNAAVRSRLTHSLEVQQTGRYIAKLIFKKLDANSLTTQLGLIDKRDGFISAVEIACLLHDVGNPPFGHFGEEAINFWARETLVQIFKDNFSDVVVLESEPSEPVDSKDNREDKSNTQQNNKAKQKVVEKVVDKYLRDLLSFEGNAQAIRLLHSLQELNLTYTQVAGLFKYTRPAYEDKPEETSDFKYRKKKPGFYLSEESYVSELMSTLNIEAGCRFPLAYIMEAADDISYSIADLDDALDKGILDVEQLSQAIRNQWNAYKGQKGISDAVVEEGYLLKIEKEALTNYQSTVINKSHHYILKLRTSLVNDLANYAAERFVSNHQAIFDGTFDMPLLGGNDSYDLAAKTLKDVAVSKVFSDKEVERLELKGFSVIKGLLLIYTPLLKLSFVEFKSLATSNFLKTHPIETRLFRDLSRKHISTYLNSVEDVYKLEKQENDILKKELYYRCRLIIDYVSGMTDRFALDEYRELSASI
ncbi:dGTPase [Rheinheimera sp. UJ51]|uniref:dGTPase n=1 Tax=Rheinheimera sp. UJ51 TaxID=2892446 RepID=UPI001E5087C7|nr:dGTPase [Rheinheimera sp. UJ51]MCC5453138.1 dGTPase [Rheinheimera sp. UJ51]